MIRRRSEGQGKESEDDGGFALLEDPGRLLGGQVGTEQGLEGGRVQGGPVAVAAMAVKG